MITINYPAPDFKIKQIGGKDTIFDECRKLWVPLTPEEWVRQNFLQYLIQVKHYPASLIAVERVIMLGDVKKRFDIVVFREAAPWMIVECKEVGVQLTESVIQQVLNYNIALQVKYLVITNGKSTAAMYIEGRKFEWLNALPDF